MSTPGLSAVAAWVLRSLIEHPHLRTIDAITAGPMAPAGADSRQVAGGLDELRRHGLAEEEAGVGWRATEAAHATS